MEPDPAPTVGGLIRYWRTARGLSQMRLALDVGISPRHMSFVETGRATPSRSLVLRLARQLGVPGREENALLESAGYARLHRETPLDADDMGHLRSVLAFLLERHEPNGALVVDRNWDIVMHNQAHERTLHWLLDGEVGADVASNLLRLTFHPAGLRSRIVNLAAVGRVLLARVDREIAETPSGTALRALRDEIRGYGPLGREGDAAPENPFVLPVHLRKGDVDLRFFTVASTVGSATDLTLQELRLESFFPADPESRAALAVLHSA